MAEPSGPPPPDFYIAAMGRSGSTMLCNWLSTPPQRIVFNEPFFARAMNSRLLRIQLENLGMTVADDEWVQRAESPMERFDRLMGARLRGRSWAAKEVLCQEHFAMTSAFRPPRVIVTIRDIQHVALSLFEKHRIQQKMDRFNDDWVAEYCIRESAGLVDYVAHLEGTGIPFYVARYEDFGRSEAERSKIAAFVCWPGGGDPAVNFEDFERGFEARRHAERGEVKASRALPDSCIRAARDLAERCSSYQARFGY